MTDTKVRAFAREAKAFVYAILIHAALLALLFLSLNLAPTALTSPPSNAPAPVQATMLDEAQIEREVEVLKQKEAEKQRREEDAQRRLVEAERKRQQEEKRVAELEQKRKEEQQRAKALEEERKVEEAKLSKLKLEQEQRRKEEEARKKKEEEQQKSVKKKEEDDKRRKEKECENELTKAKGKKTLDSATLKKLEDLCAPSVVKKFEGERKEEDKRQKETADKQRREQEMRDELAREQGERAAQSALSQFVPIIRQKVQRHWTRPPGAAAGMFAQVRVRLTPTGEVLSAEVVGSSGNPIFDRSVENAVLKASPLPIPQEAGVNERFRDIQFKFIPEER
jgi:colicin import membrane protein